VNEQESARIGGYRVVRKLGEGPRAEIFLGYPAREGADEGPAALKIYRQHIEQSAIIREIEALSRASGPHVVGLRDISLGSSRALVLDRLSRGGLSRLLRERDGFHVGEAITILVPLIEAISRMHAAGAVHGAVSPERVLFTTDGAPVIVGFGGAALIHPRLPPARLAEDGGVGSDLRALASLTASVLARVGDSRALQVADWAGDVTTRGRDGWCAQLTARLFDLGDAAPIEFDVDPASVSISLGRLVAPVSRHAEPPDGSPMTRLAVGMPDWLDPLVARAVGVISVPLTRARAKLGVVRPAVWAVAALGAIALAAAVALVPNETSDAALTPTPTSTVVTDVDSATGSADAVVMGDDPIAAAVSLLELRDRCFRELSVICLDDVAQQGSSALATDQAAMRETQNGAELPLPLPADAERLSIVEQAGDAVLLEWKTPAQNQPASLLLMKGEAGWRIRDYLSQ